MHQNKDYKQRVWKPKNYHIAKTCRLKQISQRIENYNKQYPTPKYLQFIKTMLEHGWSVKLYVAGVSKYVFVEKDQHIYKIRFSNHKPIYQREIENDCDFYVGISHKTVHKTEEIVNILQEKLNQKHG